MVVVKWQAYPGLWKRRHFCYDLTNIEHIQSALLTPTKCERQNTTFAIKRKVPTLTIGMWVSRRSCCSFFDIDILDSSCAGNFLTLSSSMTRGVKWQTMLNFTTPLAPASPFYNIYCMT